MQWKTVLNCPAHARYSSVVLLLPFMPNLVSNFARRDFCYTEPRLGLFAGFMCSPVWQLFYLALITALGRLSGP